jgi:hypothetical protein
MEPLAKLTNLRELQLGYFIPVYPSSLAYLGKSLQHLTRLELFPDYTRSRFDELAKHLPQLQELRLSSQQSIGDLDVKELRHLPGSKCSGLSVHIRGWVPGQYEEFQAWLKEDGHGLQLLKVRAWQGLELPACLSRLTRLDAVCWRISLDSLAALTTLQHLVLLSETRLPTLLPLVQCLVQLTHLTLNRENFSESIASELTNLPQLQQLAVVKRDLGAATAAAALVPLSSLQSLTSLSVRMSLTKKRVAAKLAALTQLRHIDLGEDASPGCRPRAVLLLTQLVQLTKLELRIYAKGWGCREVALMGCRVVDRGDAPYKLEGNVPEQLLKLLKQLCPTLE